MSRVSGHHRDDGSASEGGFRPGSSGGSQPREESRIRSNGGKVEKWGRRRFGLGTRGGVGSVTRYGVGSMTTGRRSCKRGVVVLRGNSLETDDGEGRDDPGSTEVA